MKLKIVTNERLVVSTYYGEINDAEILGHAAVIRSDPDFDPSFSEIADFSQVTAGTISTFAVRELSQRESIYRPSSMHVAITPQPHFFGLARMFQALAELKRPNVVVVRTLAEARKALGLETTGLVQAKQG